MARRVTVSLAEQRYAKTLLTYLHNHYSRKINVNDSYLIYAVVAWLHAADKEWPGRLKARNPFGVLNAKGKLERYNTIEAGIAGAARTLIRKASAPKGIGIIAAGAGTAYYRGALNALKSGGNTGAGQFLVWLAYTPWSPSNYGWDMGEDASKAENNKLIAWYLRLGSMEKVIVRKKKKTVTIPRAPRDLNPPVLTHDYIDPWAVLGFYRARHSSIPVLPGLDE